MVFEEVFRVVTKLVVLEQLFGDGSTKLMAACLEEFDLAKLRFVGHQNTPLKLIQTQILWFSFSGLLRGNRSRLIGLRRSVVAVFCHE